MQARTLERAHAHARPSTTDDPSIPFILAECLGLGFVAIVVAVITFSVVKPHFEEDANKCEVSASLR